MPTQWKSHIPNGRPLWSLLEDARVDADGDALTVHGRWGDIEITDDSALVREALHRMTLGPVSLENISALHENFVSWKAGETGGGRCGAWRRLKRTLDALGGCVVPSLGLDDGAGPVLSVVAVTGRVVFTLPHVYANEPVRLQPFTEIESLNGDQALACPGNAYQVILHRAPAPEVAKSLLDTETTIGEISDALQLHRPLVSDIVAYLAGAGLLLRGTTPNG